MPNHVLTQIVFTEVDATERRRIISLVGGKDGVIDFNTLVPIPANIWLGNVNSDVRVFPGNALDWCTKNWSTKWNAYGLDDEDRGRYRSVVEGEDTLTLTFKSAWSTPYGWLLALFNTSGLPFTYSWLDEGRRDARVGHFMRRVSPWDREWKEAIASGDETHLLRKLMFGVESSEQES